MFLFFTCDFILIFFNLPIPKPLPLAPLLCQLIRNIRIADERKHILLQSEEYLCSASNTNRRRFKYCSSGVCLGGSVRVRQRVCASEVEPLLVVYTKG